MAAHPDGPDDAAVAQATAVERAFRIGFAGNVGLAVTKLVVGTLAGSRALVADGWHSLSDIVTNGGAWLVHRFARREPDDDHHFGHAKAEAFAGLAIGAALVAGGAAVIWSASVSRAELEPGWRGWLALAVAVLSIAVNVGLAWVTYDAGRGAQSQGLLALARDNGSDALGGVLVVGGILGAKLGLGWTEPFAAILIGGLIIVMGWRSAAEGFDVLMDRVSDPELRAALRASAASVEAVRGVQRVRVHPVGDGYVADMEISVDGALTVDEGHRIAHLVESAVTEAHLPVKEVHVHVNPWSADSPGGAVAADREGQA